MNIISSKWKIFANLAVTINISLSKDQPGLQYQRSFTRNYWASFNKKQEWRTLCHSIKINKRQRKKRWMLWQVLHQQPCNAFKIKDKEQNKEGVTIKVVDLVFIKKPMPKMFISEIRSTYCPNKNKTNDRSILYFRKHLWLILCSWFLLQHTAWHSNDGKDSFEPCVY